MRMPCFTVASNSVDRLMRLRAGSTAENLTRRSGRQRAATLTPPVRHDRTAGTGTHPQPEAMHAGSPPVVRLEGPLALGHDVLLVVSRSYFPNQPAADRVVRGFGRRWSCYWPARSPDNPGSQPHRRLSGDCLRVLTRLRRVKPDLPRRHDPKHNRPPVASDHSDGGASGESSPVDLKQVGWNATQRLAAARKTASFCQGRFKTRAALENEARMVDRLAA